MTAGRPARTLRVTPVPEQSDAPRRTVGPTDLDTRIRQGPDGALRVIRGDTIVRAMVSPPGRTDRLGRQRIEVVVDGWRFELDVEDERRAVLRDRARRDRDEGTAGGPAEIRAIIPGRVVAVGVTAGDEVAAGDRLLVLEAMKMQNELRAPRSGRVARVAVAEGQTVEAGDVLLVLE